MSLPAPSQKDLEKLLKQKVNPELSDVPDEDGIPPSGYRRIIGTLKLQRKMMIEEGWDTSEIDTKIADLQDKIDKLSAQG